ncbi:MAG: 50S ribosomal protein L29 [Candidatus Binataceae bacterium]|jgi:ribosomal protein L29
MNTGDLRVKERETREEIFRLRLKLKTNQLDKSAALTVARRELARILTVIKQKSADADGAAKAK